MLNRIKKEAPDILLLDLWMPVLSGHDIINIIRNTAKINHLPIIVLSASHNDKEFALDGCANKFISKPFDMDEVIRTVEEFHRSDYI